MKQCPIRPLWNSYTTQGWNRDWRNRLLPSFMKQCPIRPIWNGYTNQGWQGGLEEQTRPRIQAKIRPIWNSYTNRGWNGGWRNELGLKGRVTLPLTLLNWLHHRDLIIMSEDQRVPVHIGGTSPLWTPGMRQRPVRSRYEKKKRATVRSRRGAAAAATYVVAHTDRFVLIAV